MEVVCFRLGQGGLTSAYSERCAVLRPSESRYSCRYDKHLLARKRARYSAAVTLITHLPRRAMVWTSRRVGALFDMRSS